MMNKKLVGIALSIVFAIVQISSAVSTPSGIMVSNTKYEPYPAEPGGYLELWFLVKNRGDKSAENIILQLVPEYPFSVDREHDSDWTSIVLAGGGEAVVSFKVRVDVNAIEGVSEVKLKFWAGGETSAITETFYIQVAGKKNIEISEISPLILKPGEIANLNFTIVNKGKSPIQDITFTWQESKDMILPVGSDNKRYVKYLDVDQSVEISFKVASSPSAPPGVYSLMMSISYTDTNKTQRNLSSRAGIVIGGTTEFEVSQQESTSGVISLAIANVGVNPAYSIVVFIPHQQGMSMSGSSSTVIGNLDPGDYTFASFQISRNFTSIARTQENPNKLLVGIQYTDTLGQRQTLFKEVALQSMSTGITQSIGSSRTSDTTWMYLGGAVAILALLAIWKRDRILQVIGKKK
ncbi:MAG: COG1361 S-layer family protein [Halobacteria archaeon]